MEQAHRTATEKRVSGSDSLTEQKITGFYRKAQLKEAIMVRCCLKSRMKGDESVRTNVVALQLNQALTDSEKRFCRSRSSDFYFRSRVWATIVLASVNRPTIPVRMISHILFVNDKSKTMAIAPMKRSSPYNAVAHSTINRYVFPWDSG